MLIEEKVCQSYGNPKSILTDGEPNFDSAEVRDFATDASAERGIISAYDPGRNAKLEKMSRTLKPAEQKVNGTIVFKRCLVVIKDDPEQVENHISKYF